MTTQQVSLDKDVADGGRWSINLTPLPMRFLRVSPLVILGVAFLHLITTDYFFSHVLGRSGDGNADAIRNLFQMEYEQSIPTWISTMLLMACGVVLLAIGGFETSRRARSRYAWLSLGVIFVLMSLDEHVGIHEVGSIYLGKVVHGKGFLSYEWVIPGFVFVAAAALFYWRAFRRLPQPYPLLFFGAGAIYVSGALLTEMIEAKVRSNPDASEFAVMLSFLVQDPLEFLGASLFLYALARYCVEQLGWRRLTFEASPPAA